MGQKVVIHIDQFDGPFDLLFYLLKKNKLDIYDIPINEITEQYLDYLFDMQSLNMEIASEFLVMASTLLHIKSRIILPRYDEEDEEDEEEIDSKEELILRLIEYKKYKDIVVKFTDMQEKAKCILYKYPELIHFKKYVEKGTHNAFELWNYYSGIVENINVNIASNREKMDMIKRREKVSVKEKMNQIMDVLRKKTSFIFNDFCKKKEFTKLEKATSFMGILELSRLNEIRIRQNGLFEKILIKKTKGRK